MMDNTLTYEERQEIIEKDTKEFTDGFKNMSQGEREGLVKGILNKARITGVDFKAYTKMMEEILPRKIFIVAVPLMKLWCRLHPDIYKSYDEVVYATHALGLLALHSTYCKDQMN